MKTKLKRKHIVNHHSPVLAAAVRHGLDVYYLDKPARHHNVLWHMNGLIPACERFYEDEEQGFVDENLTFMSRYMSKKVALLNNQIVDSKFDELYSEDLW